MLSLSLAFLGIVSSVSMTYYQYWTNDDGSVDEVSYTQEITAGGPIGDKVSASFDQNNPEASWIMVGTDTYTFPDPYITTDHAWGSYTEGGSGGYDGYSAEVTPSWASLDLRDGQLDGDVGWSRDYVLNITPVPEPSTWTMLLFSLAGIGVALRLRRQGAWSG